MKSVAILFPGQGSQHVGMGEALTARYSQAARRIEAASEILGCDLASICATGGDGLLSETSIAQPAVFALSFVAWEVFREGVGLDWRPVAMAGHSLGELTALTAAGAMEFSAALILVQRRALAMKAAGDEVSGGMLAILGADEQEMERRIEETIREVGGVIDIANVNCPGQVVVGGDRESLKELAARCRKDKVRHVRLQVSVAPHTSLMSPAVAPLRKAIAETAIEAPKIPVVGNVRADFLRTANEIRQELVEQLTHPVRWWDSMQRLIDDRLEAAIEVGPGKVLTGLMRRIDDSVAVHRFGDEVVDIESFVSTLYT